MSAIFSYKNSCALAVLLLSVSVPFVASASNSWANYHWARTASSSTLNLGDNVSSLWDSYLQTSSIDWSMSSVMDTPVVSGASKRNCGAVPGRVEVCNKTYGKNGWLGIANISVSGGHITQGTVKLNDTYFNTATYNTPAWRNLVMCQEIGHTLGLDHQDEILNNTNLGTCMDYTNSPASNQHPNQHDHDMLTSIYLHLDTFTTLFASTITNSTLPSIFNSRSENNFDEPAEWGKEIRISNDKQNSVYERKLWNGQKVFTFVIWADRK